MIAWLAGVPRPEAHRLRMVRRACTGYLLIAGVVAAECLAAVDPHTITPAPPIATALASAGAALLAGTTIIVLSDLTHFPCSPMNRWPSRSPRRDLENL